MVFGLLIGGAAWFYWPTPQQPVDVPANFQGKRPAVASLPPARFYVLREGYTKDADWSDVVEGGETRKVSLPTLMYLLDYQGRNRKVLIDAGYGSHFAEQIKKFPASLFFKLIKPVVPPEWSLKRQLAKIGLKPESITHVVLTHLHNDHAGNLRELRRAKIVVPRSEWEWANQWLSVRSMYLKDQLTDLEGRLRLLNYPGHAPYGTFKQSIDLFGDGSLIVVNMPGHTQGSQGVFVNLASGKTFFLTGDTAWVKAHYQRPVTKGRLARKLLEYDETLVWEQLQRIRQLSRIAPEITIIPGHDPDVYASLKHFPEYYE
jgi:glyoxylase-like metal-dependent hydrolase (beta-lactamase superfamily II)